MQELAANCFNRYAIWTGDNAASQAACVEVVIVTSEPHYAIDQGQIVKHRISNTIRFATSPAGLRQLAADFLREAEEVEALPILSSSVPSVPSVS